MPFSPSSLCLTLSASSPAHSPGEIRVSLLDSRTGDVQLREAGLWHPGFPDGWQDKHLVRVLELAPTLDGAFVALNGPRGKTQGLLSCPRSWFKQKKIYEGALIEAQISRAAQNGKGLRLIPSASPRMALPQDANLRPHLISAGPTILESMVDSANRLLTEDDGNKISRHISIFYDDAELTAHVPTHLRPYLHRLTPQGNEGLFRGQEWEDVWDSLTLPTTPVGPLIGHFSHTPALVAIDLDRGESSRKQDDFEANLAAFPEILRQIRLRNLSGLILIDPAGVKSSKRPALLPFLRRAMEKEADPLSPRLSGITPAGLIEIIRPRHRPSLYDIMHAPHGRGLSILRQILANKPPASSSVPLPSVLHAPADIVTALKNDTLALDEFALHYGGRLALKIAQNPQPLCWTLT